MEPRMGIASMPISANENPMIRENELRKSGTDDVAADTALDNATAEPAASVTGSRPASERADTPVSEEELSQMQQERLAAIRRAVETGAYDSDELLEKSIRLMMERIDADEDLQ